MSRLRNAVGREARAAEAGLWGCAGALALATHIGAAAWLVREPPALAAEDAPTSAIMVEFSPEPEAVFTETNEIAPDLETAAPSDAAEATPMPDEARSPERTDRMEPVPTEAREQDAPVEPVRAAAEPAGRETASAADDPVILPDGVDVPLPALRPGSQERMPAKAKVEPRQFEAKKPRRESQRPAASTSATAAQAQVTRSDRNAGRQNASGGSSMAPARWQSRLMAHLERHKRYPSAARARGEQGTVYVRFGIDGSGNVLSVTLARSSGFPDLDGEVLSLVRRASPIPAPPPGSATSITVPIRFSVR